MCGIAGFTGCSSPGLLRAMCASLRHRGPDDFGSYEGDGISLAMQRLAIVDIEGGRQPISNEDRTIRAIFNGELYNHKELRLKLQKYGHHFSTHHSDSEVIVHLYEQYGDGWQRLVNGMFAVGIWDSRQGKLILSRDRLGKKPLYWAKIEGELIFASEIKAICRHPGVSREIDRGSLWNYFSNKTTIGRATIYRQIQQLLPGQSLTWEKKEHFITTWWKNDFPPTNRTISEGEAAEEINYLLAEAVKDRINCDVPYGAYLSGGLDSSAVVTLMARHTSRPIKTFSLGYDEKDFGQFTGKNEDIKFARKISTALNTEHYEHIIDAKEFVKHLPDVISSFDEPFSGTISTFYLSSFLQKHVKVALSGDGADELFGSYLIHRLARPIQYWLKLQKAGHRTYQTLTDEDLKKCSPFDSPEAFAFMASIADENQAKWRAKLAVFSNDEKRRLLNPDYFGDLHKYNDIFNDIETGLGAPQEDAVNRVLEFDQKQLLPDQILPFIDRLSMAHSVEVRCPFLDYRLVQFVNSLPGHMKIHGRLNKKVLKTALRRIIPEDIIQRNKEGFVQPIYTWMHGTLKLWILNELKSLPPAVFNEKELNRYIQLFLEENNAINGKIWNLVCFSIWWKGYSR